MTQMKTNAKTQKTQKPPKTLEGFFYNIAQNENGNIFVLCHNF